jgi:DNA mismatch endonuclease (patch repair protein)
MGSDLDDRLPAAEWSQGSHIPASGGYRPRDPAVVSRNMRAVRGRDNAAESLLRRHLWQRGHRYRRYAPAPGRPDVAFSGRRVAVFVDGDFWHARCLMERGPDALRASLRTDRRDWWIAKLSANEARDRRVDTDLAKAGWVVVRVWERDVLADPSASADRVCAALHPSSVRHPTMLHKK